MSENLAPATFILSNIKTTLHHVGSWTDSELIVEQVGKALENHGFAEFKAKSGALVSAEYDDEFDLFALSVNLPITSVFGESE